MSPEEAVARALEEIENRPNLRIAAVSGPGEPLANAATFATLQGIKTSVPHIHFCLSTNGILLARKVSMLRELDVETVSVSLSTINPKSAARIYEWAILDGILMQGEEMGRVVIEKQLKGIRDASKAGIRVKVNSILIPSINTHEISMLSNEVAKSGAAIQNIVPLVPNANMLHLQAPSQSELADARRTAGHFIKQFHHCHQCRSDVVGIPGDDTPL
jgi:nitrogen fixation protein NifB